MRFGTIAKYLLMVTLLAAGVVLSSIPATAAAPGRHPDAVEPRADGHCYWRHVDGHWAWADGRRHWVPPRTVWVCD